MHKKLFLSLLIVSTSNILAMSEQTCDQPLKNPIPHRFETSLHLIEQLARKRRHPVILNKFGKMSTKLTLVFKNGSRIVTSVHEHIIDSATTSKTTYFYPDGNRKHIEGNPSIIEQLQSDIGVVRRSLLKHLK